MTEQNDNRVQPDASPLPQTDPAAPEMSPIQTTAVDGEEKTVHFAGFWMRFWAYLTDLIVIGSLNRILVHPIFKFYKEPGNNWFSLETLLTAFVFFLYFILMTKYLNQTLGKMIFGLRVVALKEEAMTWGTVLFRELVGRYISKVTWIGYLLAGLLPKKQALHDVFADTSVILVRR